MIIDKENNEIHIRLGNDYKFISSIMLNNGTRIVNMQCSLIEPVPTEAELQEFENKVKGTFKMDLQKELEHLKSIMVNNLERKL